MVKKIWYTHAVEYNSVIERNEIVPFAEMWMDPETVIQSEVSQKEKNKCVLIHIWESRKNGIDELICKAEIEAQTQRTNVWLPRRKGGSGMDLEVRIDIYTELCMKQIANEN